MLFAPSVKLPYASIFWVDCASVRFWLEAVIAPGLIESSTDYEILKDR